MKSAIEQIRSMLQVDPQPDGFSAALLVDPAFTILPDHFASGPIFPGMCIVQAVLLAAERALNQGPLRLHHLKNAKLMHPILPGEQVTIQAQTTTDAEGHLTIKARITGQEKRRAEISMTASFLPRVTHA